MYVYYIAYATCHKTSQYGYDHQTLHVGNPLPAFGGNGRSTAQEYLITPGTWQWGNQRLALGFLWTWRGPKRGTTWVTKHIELDCQQRKWFMVLYNTLDFRLKTQDNVPELAGLVHTKTYTPLVSHTMDEVA